MSPQIRPGSKAYRTQLRKRLADLGFAGEIIPTWVAKNLTAECSIRPRTAWRLAREMSLDLAARQYNTMHGNPRAGMRGSRIWEYEQWPYRGVRPTLPGLRNLARVYGTDWRSLLDLHDLEHLQGKDVAEYHSAPEVPSPGVVPALPLHIPVKSEHSVAIGNAADSALTEAIVLTQTNVDDAQLDDLWSEVDRLGSAYTGMPPASVLSQLSLVRTRATALLLGRQRLKHTRDLYLITAKCSAMMGWTSADLGRYGAARELTSAAWLYGRYADDPMARRWVRSAQSRVEYWAGNGAESARLAADGLTNKVGSAVMDTSLILAEARGWASAHALRKVFDAIERWTRIEDADSTTAAEDTFFNVSKDRRHYMAGASLLAAGRADLALKELRTAGQVYRTLAPEHRWAAMGPMIQIETARTYLQLGELDGTAVELEPFLTADVGQWPDMVRATLTAMTRDLADPRFRRSQTARGLVDALRVSRVAG